MPELPEVEAWRRTIHRWLQGRTVDAVQLVDPAVVRPRLSTRPSDGWDQAASWVKGLVGCRLEGTDRVGKRLGLRLGEHAILVHLGMTGRFARGAQPRSARLGLVLDDGEVVWFADTRRFGCWVPLGDPSRLRDGLGPDALDAALDGPSLKARLTGRRAVKVALLDQKRIAGLGNIHAAEALWRAGIAPTEPCDRIDDGAWSRLAKAIGLQLRQAIEEIPEGEDFVYLTDGGDNPFAVYGREGAPCPRCQGPIHRAAQGGRSTFWCPRCQQPHPR